MTRVCIVGISGKLGQYMTELALERGWDVVGICRPESVQKLDRFGDQIEVIPGRTDDAEVIARAVKGADKVLTVLVPWGIQDYASGTARAVLQHADPKARLAFSCGWHISRDGLDVFSWKLKLLIAIATPLARLARFADINDQVRACDLIFASDRNWTVVRGSDLSEGPSEGLPQWAEHVGDAKLARNMTRRIDFARFMLHAVTSPELTRKAPAISGPPAPIHPLREA